MPEIDGGQHECWRGGGRNSIKRIKITGAIEASDLGLGQVSEVRLKTEGWLWRSQWLDHPCGSEVCHL